MLPSFIGPLATRKALIWRNEAVPQFRVCAFSQPMREVSPAAPRPPPRDRRVAILIDADRSSSHTHVNMWQKPRRCRPQVEGPNDNLPALPSQSWNLGLQLFQNMCGKELVNLPMSRHWLGDTRFWVAVPIVFAAVSDKNASSIFELASQVSTLHQIDNSATRRTPGISPLVKS